MLSDESIVDLMRRDNDPLVITNLEDPFKQVQPVSVDLSLSTSILKYFDTHGSYLEVGNEPPMFPIKIGRDIEHSYLLRPGEFVLGSTREFVEIPSDHCATVEGRSSCGRLGLMIHVTAGLIDPGFKGNITLEIYNVNSIPIRLKEGIGICQLCVHKINGIVVRPYGTNGLGSKYQNSHGTVAPKASV